MSIAQLHAVSSLKPKTLTPRIASYVVFIANPVQVEGGSGIEDTAFQDLATDRCEADFQDILQDIPQGIAHLDFGLRDGGGVVGPKLDSSGSRQADKFEVQEGDLHAMIVRQYPSPVQYIKLYKNLSTSHFMS